VIKLKFFKKKWQKSDGYKEIYEYKPETEQEIKSQEEDQEFLYAVDAGIGCLRYFIALILLIFFILVIMAIF